MSDKTMIRNLTEGHVRSQLIRYSLPFILSNLLQTVYNLVDMIVVGQFVGKVGLSAVSIGGDLLNFFTFICMGFCSAGQIIIAQYVGKQEYGNVQKAIGTFFTFIMALAVVFTAVGLVFKDAFLQFMNVPPDAYEQAYEYTVVCSAGLIFVYGYNIVAAVLRGMGNSKTPLVFVVVAAIVNLILDYILVAFFDTGAAGAAVATVFGQGVAFVSAIVYLYRKKEQFNFDFKLKSFKINGKIMGLIVRLGIPMALQSCAIIVSALVVNSYINVYGVVASAVTGVGSKLGSVASIVTNGLNTAGAAMVGQNFAAGKQDRMKKIIGLVAVYSLLFAAILSVIMIAAPEAVFGIFDNSPDVMDMARDYVIIAVINFFGFATRAPFLALINGQGFAALSFVGGIMDGVVIRIFLSIFLGKTMGMGIMGFWIGSVVAGYAYGVMGSFYYFTGLWKKRQLAIN